MDLCPSIVFVDRNGKVVEGFEELIQGCSGSKKHGGSSLTIFLTTTEHIV